MKFIYLIKTRNNRFFMKNTILLAKKFHEYVFPESFSQKKSVHIRNENTFETYIRVWIALIFRIVIKR